MKFLKWFLGLFSPYVHPFERKVDKFFKGIKSTDGLADIREGLLALMQENMIVTNVWMEKRYKGYKYLSKGVRRKMYADVEKMVAKFQAEEAASDIDEKMVKAALDEKGLSFPTGDGDKIVYLARIMDFLMPKKHYHYIKTASFGKLLRDPAKEKLEGDCNQIVTLYSFLFSLKFPLEELRIKLLPEHVCLHFRGIDIESTAAIFEKYEDDTKVLPVTEIISTNLLDLADFREAVQSISPRTFVKSAQLAYAISSLKPLVERNLKAAYQNVGVSALKSNDFETAIFFFEKMGDRELIHNAYHNAAVYYMKRHDFKKARYYAGRSDERDLEKTVKHNEAVYHFKQENFARALELFKSLGDLEMEKAIYAQQYNKLAQKVRGVKTVQDAKRYKSDYRKMLDLAVKMGDSKLASGLRKTISSIK
jgi:tetratricopeptide (TPR) repeat protein